MKNAIISAIMPVYNGVKYIIEAIQSIQSQTFTDWELIVINEFGSNDGSAEVIEEYAKNDKRIKLIQNDTRLGLAQSLNVGIFHAHGKYIARVDVDDPSYSERFEKQYAFMESNPEIFMCGTLTRSVLPSSNYILEVPCNREELKAALLFGCEISHCTVMFRREEFVKKKYFYNPEMLSEDYDLWTRIMFDENIVNLPEVLVDHRWGFENISLEKGEMLHQNVRSISAETIFRNFGVSVPENNLILLSSWRNKPTEFAKRNSSYFLTETFSLLEEIERKNLELNIIEPSALQKILLKRWNWACEVCGIKFDNIDYSKLQHGEEKPVVSVILPVYRAASTLREAIDSIITQDFTAWELLVICEAGCFDGSIEIAEYYAKFDKRVKVIVNHERLGLSGALNKGIELAQGKYIARIDADDISEHNRLSVQTDYMEKRPDIGITQTYQRYFGKGIDNFVHRPPLSSAEMKAKLLFFCDACHSTVMIKKSVLDKYNLRYDTTAELEDYDLWIRMVNVTDFETIPEILGNYRVGNDNISLYKSEQIRLEMCRKTATLLKENLNINVDENKIRLLGGWTNVFNDMPDREKDIQLEALRDILLKIWNSNKKNKFYDRKALLSAICAKWRWSKYDEPWQGKKTVRSITAAVQLHQKKKGKLYKIFVEKPLRTMQSASWHINALNTRYLNAVINDVANAQISQIDSSIEHWTWERYKRIADKLDAMERNYAYLQNSVAKMHYKNNQVHYVPGEKIRIVFLFQIASFYPSWESLLESCKTDERVDARLVFLDETNTEKSQMLTAHSFLEENSMVYENFDQFSFEQFRPHILVIQTPYDEWHRKEEHWANRFREQGFRLVYIPYGIEISDTEDSHKLHFNTNVINNCWRIYTFSETMCEDYMKYSSNGSSVRALGLPRFDYYYKAKKTSLPEHVETRRNGRPVVLWKVHFPKIIYENEQNITVTPSLDEYVKFAEKICNYKELFFVLMPHPKFLEKNKNPETQAKLSQIIETVAASENTWIDTNQDYRNSLMCANYIIVDRSAVMVEAGALGVPVLYMSNPIYYEPVTKAIKSLIDSYYQGTTCEDMCNFLDMCLSGKDIMLTARKRAFKECIPYFDGKCGERVKEDMINGVINEES